MCDYGRNIMDTREMSSFVLSDVYSSYVLCIALGWGWFDMLSSSDCANLWVHLPPKNFPLLSSHFFLTFFPISFALWGLFVYLSFIRAAGWAIMLSLYV